MTTPSYPQLRELISRLEGKDKAVVSMALYCLDKMDKKEEKLVNEAQSRRYSGEWGMSDDLTIAYMLGVEDMRDTQHKHAGEIKRLRAENAELRQALTAILNDVGYHNPMRMTTDIRQGSV